jgi:Na+-transporting NADH:ubiquinone oxidoreductase subunit NqrB
MLFQDARIYQILFLSLFLLLGIGTRDWTLKPEMVGVAIATCLITQWLWVQAEGKHEICPLPSAFLSPLITALGLSLLLRTDHLSTMMVAGVVAISSKYLLRINNKHVFNPANVGIVAAVLLTHDAWISPGQWGEESWYALLFLGTGGVVLRRVGRWDTTCAFLGSYALLEGIRNLWLGWTWDVWLHRLSNGSLLLFALFMITDPRTIPNARVARLVWAGAIALLAFILRNVFFLPTAVFWALFLVTPTTILLDWLWQGSRFTWRSPPPPDPTTPERSTLDYSTLEHSTLEHSTLEHSTLEHSTLEHSTLYQFSGKPHRISDPPNPLKKGELEGSHLFKGG